MFDTIFKQFYESFYDYLARVEAKKADVHEADKLKWEHEQKISNKTAKLDECRRDCNHLIIGLDMVEDDSKALIKAEPDVIQNWAQRYVDEIPQYPQRILNRIEKPFYKTFAGLKCMLQGFRIYFI